MKTGRHAYLILCHQSPALVNLLTGLLAGFAPGEDPLAGTSRVSGASCAKEDAGEKGAAFAAQAAALADSAAATPPEEAFVLVHLDRQAAHLLPALRPRPGVRFFCRHRVLWGGFSVVRATLDLLREGLRGPWTRFHLLSGQCLPLLPRPELEARFAPDCEYLDCRPFPVPGLFMGGMDRLLVPWPEELHGRFRGARAERLHDYRLQVMATPALQRCLDGLPTPYHGSQWFSISREFACFVLDYTARRRDVTAFFSESQIPDEMFLQTLCMDSPFAARRAPSTLRYMDWVKGGPHTLEEEDLAPALASGAVFARKFSLDKAPAAVAALLHRIGSGCR